MHTQADKTLEKTRFRPAVKADCRQIAALYRISSDGVADYIWSKLSNEDDDCLSVGEQRYAREDSDFSYRNCTIIEKVEKAENAKSVENDQAVIGMLVAFPMHVDTDSQAQDNNIDPVLAPYSKLELNNSYYICGMALILEYRGKGIGTRLLALAEQHALAKGFKQMSLIVFEQNQAALALYQRHGYEELMREAIYPHPLIHFTGDALLMGKQLVES